MNFFERKCCKKQEIVMPFSDIYFYISFLMIMLPHMVVAVDKLSHIGLMILIFFNEMIYTLAHLTWISLPLEEAIVLSCKKPRSRIAPNISSIIQNQMILSPSWKYVLHWLCFKIHVFIPTNYTMRSETLVALEKSHIGLTPRVDVEGWWLTSPLMPNPSTNAVGIDSSTFSIDINLK